MAQAVTSERARAACGVKEKKRFQLRFFYLAILSSFLPVIGCLLVSSYKNGRHISLVRGVGWEDDAIFELPGRDPVDF
jgi:hypothetical protein